MKYKVELESRARRELLTLPAEIVRELAEAIDGLQNNPRPTGAKKLMAKEGYRIRRGAYRVLYAIDDDAHVVRIYRVGHRREVYR